MDSNREHAKSFSTPVEMGQKGLRVPRAVTGTRGDLPAGQRPRNKRVSLLWRRKGRPTVRSSAICQVPNEILLLIFGLIERDIIDPSVFGKRPREELRFLPLVSKAWYGPATNVLYEVVDLSRVSSVFKFHRSLVDRPHLRGLVKVLALPGRVWRTCPPRLMRVFLQIIDLAESLETLYSMCQLIPGPRPTDTGAGPRGDQVVLPLASAKHRQLRYLDLYANSWDLCLFPSLIAFSFEKLESLALYGFCLLGNVSPEKTPPLPNLTTVTCLYGDSISYLDEWLQSCPNVTTLLLRDTCLKMPTDDTPPLGLLRQGGLTQLKINQMYLNAADNKTSFNWFSKCEGLSLLEVDWSAFSRCRAPLPASVDTLVLRLEYEEPSLYGIVSFLDRNPGVKKFEWRVCRHDKWLISHRSRLETEMSECGVTMSLDYVPCFCLPKLIQVTADIMNPVAHWAWGYLRRIGNKEMAAIIEWERG